MTSIALGNYAEPGERAPVVAIYKAACDVSLVSKEEAKCIDKARDTASAGRCVPRMMQKLPDQGAVTPPHP